MTLSEIHIHFDWHGVKLWSVEDFKNCVYYKPGTSLKVTLPKLDGQGEEIPPELIKIACTIFRIDHPYQLDRETQAREQAKEEEE